MPPARAGRPASGAAIEDLIGKLVSDGTIAGASWCIASLDRSLAEGMAGWMDMPNQRPMGSETIFWWASQTKPVVAVAILMLMDEGKLRLEDPIDRFLPAFSRPITVGTPSDPAAPVRVPTILELLTHTSGMGSDAARDADIQALFSHNSDASLEQTAKKMAAVPYGFAPGTRWSYSAGAGFTVLGLIVEALSGQRLDAFLRERIFAPLGMTDTSFGVPESKRSRLAIVHQPRNGTLVPASLPSPFQADTRIANGAGNLCGTIDDYLAFSRMMLARGSYCGRQLLRPETAALLSANMAGALCCNGSGGQPSAGKVFGLSMEVVDDTARARTTRGEGAHGWGGGFGTSFVVDPARRTVSLYMMQMWEVPELNPAIPHKFHELAAAFHA